MTAGTFRTGMKVYDNDWFLRFDLDYDDAARLLRDWGVTFILAQSRYLPMPDTAIKSEVPEHLKDRYAAYDDRLFREALQRAGIQYVATCLVGLDPEAIAADPGLVPVDANGHAEEKIDWYQGIPPDRTVHIDGKVALVERAVQELRPDGVHLGFMRWPGFWELWLPDVSRADFPDYDYSRGTLNRFAEQTGVEVPVVPARDAAQWIARSARGAWIDWKCATVARVIGRFRDAVKAIVPDAGVVLNTLPFRRNDFDRAMSEVFGQRLEDLAPVVDVFELMCYHQILRRPSSWIADVAREAKERAADRIAVCTVQAEALYLEGMHAGRGRAASIDPPAFRDVVKTVAQSPADGILFFTFTDFLVQVLERDDHTRVDVIKMFRDMQER